MHLPAETQTRIFSRVPFDVPVRVTRTSTRQALDLRASNLSERGLFLETVLPFAEGELVRLHFPTRPGGFGAVAAARVAWRRPFGPDLPVGTAPGIGIAFLMMSPDDRLALRRLVESGGIGRSPSSATPRLPAAPWSVPGFASRIARVGLLGRADAATLETGPNAWALAVALLLAAAASLLLGTSQP